MRNQIQMLAHLSEIIPSHEFTTKGNKITAKSLVKGSTGFRNFTLNFLKNGQVSLTTSGARAMRFDSEKELIANIGGMASIKDSEWVSATRADDPNAEIAPWYRAAYPDDTVGNDLYEGVTFLDLFEALDSYKCVYETIGHNVDSIVRERVFEKLADIMNVDYDYIYKQWISSVAIPAR